jgi:hypothetical protein
MEVESDKHVWVCLVNIVIQGDECGLSIYRSRYSESLRVGRCRNRIPLWARFSAPVQAGPEADSASYAVGTGSFPELKRPGRGVNHPPI